MKVNEDWTSIITCLKAASQAAGWAFWRERFNTNHPEHIRQQEIDNPSQYAYANWVAAKHVYVMNKEQLDKHCSYLLNDCDAFPGITEQVEFFMAMRRVVEKEMEVAFENQVLKEDPMLKNKSVNPDENEVEELDEDEQYVKETGGKWDGDDYVSDDEDDDLFDDDDLDLDDEDDLEDNEY